MRDLEEINQLLAEKEAELSRLNLRRAELLGQIGELQREKSAGADAPEPPPQSGAPLAVTSVSPQTEKIALFRRLFQGRTDVYPRRFESLKTGKKGYQPACANEWVTGICEKPRIRCEECTHRAFLPVTDDVIRNHLQGLDPRDQSRRDFTIGVYPMLPDETSWFLAADFDKASWQEDAQAFLETCQLRNVPAALERSRSGQGGHVWIFFAEPVPAFQARKMGTFLLTQTMERRPEIGLDSYDRFFPSQDTLPKGGFGNLIALPLQKKPRDAGHSLFLDGAFVPHADQWAYLSSLRRMRGQEVAAVLGEADKQGELLGIRLPVTDEMDDEPWAAPPSRRRQEPAIAGPLPAQLTVVLGNQVYIPKADLTPSLRNRLIRLAAFQNPEFYQAQAMRFSTFGKPRIISCYEEFPGHLGLPRGCLADVLELFQTIKVEINLTDQRSAGAPLDVHFCGELRAEQRQAAAALLKHDCGVLAASTAFGKTVVAAYLIAQRQVSTLVIVHRKQLLDQWTEALSHFLSWPAKAIGQIGGGKHKPTGRLDVAMLQSLGRQGVVDDVVAGYGQVIVDECHHISAVSFEQVVKQCKATYVTGLSATVVRKDGHHPIIFMQCGPIRYRVSDRQQMLQRPFEHRVVVRTTTFNLPDYLEQANPLPIQEVYAALAKDEQRNQLIVADVVSAICSNRFPVLLTERRDHVDALASRLAAHIPHVFVMEGGMGKKQKKRLVEHMASLPADQPRLIVATGRYLGEGFDDDRLDTLFLALPISWRGTLTQYAGRLHRLNSAKKEAIVYDYVDANVPVLAKMYLKRRTGYKAIGYEVGEPAKAMTTSQLVLGEFVRAPETI